jgi:1-deoxy-D-xylulose-5-phosphate synthase
VKIFQSIPTEYPVSEILKDIETPCDIRKLTSSQIPQLADELREFLLYSVGRTGGHLALG